MPKNGLLIDYQWCSGCHTCEVACKQELNLPAGVWGIKVTELIQEANGKVYIDYIPHPTDICNLCEHRTSQGKIPACVHHCMTKCMAYGTLDTLVEQLKQKPKTVLWAPRE